jgi:hypothetical protein
MEEKKKLKKYDDTAKIHIVAVIITVALLVISLAVIFYPLIFKK